MKTPLGPLNQNPIFSLQKGRFQLLLESFYWLVECNTPRQDIQSHRRNTGVEEAGQDKACTGRQQPRRRKKKRRKEADGRCVASFVLTDLGRCNFREDPLRRWAQLVGALTRPLSRLGLLPSFFPLNCLFLSPHDFTCEFNLPFSYLVPETAHQRGGFQATRPGGLSPSSRIGFH